MSITQETNRLEVNTSNLTKVKNNINNKIVALGGQSALNLADVPNKLESIRGSNVKYAEGTCDTRFSLKNFSSETIASSLDFVPKTVILFPKNPKTCHPLILIAPNYMPPLKKGIPLGVNSSGTCIYIQLGSITITNDIVMEARVDVGLNFNRWIAIG